MENRKYTIGAFAVALILVVVGVLIYLSSSSPAHKDNAASPVSSSHTPDTSASATAASEPSPMRAGGTPAQGQGPEGTVTTDSPESSDSDTATVQEPSSAQENGKTQPSPEVSCPPDTAYQQGADGKFACTYDYSKERIHNVQEAEQYARTWYYPGDSVDVVLSVEDHRVDKIGVPGKDGPQSVYVVRAVSQSQRNQGGSGTIGWCVIWSNGYALQDYEIPGELSY